MIDGRTDIYGIIGDPIEHTFSPMMHNAAIQKMGINAVYLPFKVSPDSLGNALRGMVALGIKGLNVTVPHKTDVIQYLDSLTKDAEIIGAVNTILRNGNFLVGENTDIAGFMESLEFDAGLKLLPSEISIIGAGGAARSIVYGCASRKEVGRIIIVNRTLSKAEKLADDFSGITGKNIEVYRAGTDEADIVMKGSGLIINTTSVGMYPEIDRSPAHGIFRKGQVVVDIVYNPVKTLFLREAEEYGASIAGGIGMLARQGARSLSLWTEKNISPEIMIDTLHQKFKF